MSTTVQMPVRVKPPPAETGDTISPGCASFEMAMPENGARMMVLSRSVCWSSTWRSATLTCSRNALMRASVPSTSDFARSTSDCVAMPFFRSSVVRPSVRRA